MPIPRRNRRRPWLLALVLAGLVASAALSAASPRLAIPKVAGVSAQIQTPFLVEVSDGFKSRVLPWNAGPIRKNDGSPAAGLNMVNTVIRPDGTTVVFEQRTDSGGLLRGQLYASILNQTGTYTLKVHVSGGGPFQTDGFTLTDPIDLSGNNTFQGDVDVQGDLTGTTASFTGALTAGSLSGDGSALTALAADNIFSGTLADARLSGNVALKDAANTFTGQNTISGPDFSNGLTFQNTTASSTLSPNVRFRDNQGTPKSLYLRKNGDQILSVLNDAGQERLRFNASGTDAVGIGDVGPSGQGGLNINDTNLYRSAVDTLKTDDGFYADWFNANNAGTSAWLNVRSDDGSPAIRTYDASNNRVLDVSDTGTISWGTTGDTNLYRNAADVLKTDDNFRVGGDFNVTSFATFDDDLIVNGGTTDLNGPLSVDTAAAVDITIDNDSSATNAFSISSGFGTDLFNVHSDTGRAFFKNTTDSATAFRVQNAAGTTNVLTVDTTGNEVELDTSGKLVVGDTNLYRNAADELKTDDTFVASVATTAAAFDRLTTDGTIVSLRQDGIEEGTISVAGDQVSYNAFTGSHYARTGGGVEPGMLVSMTGENGRLGGREDSEIIYGVARTAKANDPAVLGSYLSVLNPKEKDGSPRPESDDNPSLVAAVGNGEVWVVENGRDLEPGDVLVSSGTAGHAMKDPGTYGRSHVIGKAAEAVDWDEVEETVGGKKHKKVSVLFGAYDTGDAGGAPAKAGTAGASEAAGTDDLVMVAVLTALGIETLRLLARSARRRRRPAAR
ncbi:MAG: hypothetical protein WD926_01875 [Patescibacteria group bacterium]